MCITGRKSPCIVEKIGLVSKMLIAERMNLDGFLDSTCIAAIGPNPLMDYLLS